MFNHLSRHNVCLKSQGSNQTVHVLYAIPSDQPAEYSWHALCFSKLL